MLASRGDENGVRVRGVLELLAEGELLFGVAVKNRGGGANWIEGLWGVKVWTITSPRISPRPARPATWVRSWKVRSPARKVGHVEADIGVEDPDEGDVGKVEALGDHLRPDEDIDHAPFEIAERVAEEVFLFHRVGVDTGDAVIGENFPEDDFDLLRSVTGEPDRRTRALGALRGSETLEGADVAEQFVIGAMKSEGHAAMVALAHETAFLAGERGCEAAAVEEEDRSARPSRAAR